MLKIPLHETNLVRTLVVAVDRIMVSYQEDFFTMDLPEIKRLFESDKDSLIDHKTVEVDQMRFVKGSSELNEVENSDDKNYFIIIRPTGTQFFSVKNELTAMVMFSQFSEIILSGDAEVYECNFLKDEAFKIDVLKDERFNKYFKYGK